MPKSWQPNTNTDGYDTPRGQESFGDQSKPSDNERSDAQGSTAINPIDVPMAGNARESLRHAVHDSNTPERYGLRGKAANLGVNELDCIAEAERYDTGSYESLGVSVSTGRSKATKFTGAR